MGAASTSPDVAQARAPKKNRSAAEIAEIRPRWKENREKRNTGKVNGLLTPPISRDLTVARQALDPNSPQKRSPEDALTVIAGGAVDKQTPIGGESATQPDILTPKQYTRGEVSQVLAQKIGGKGAEKFTINGVVIEPALQPGGGPTDSIAIQEGIMRELHKVLDKGDDTIGAAQEFIKVATEAGISPEELKDALGKRLTETEMKAVFPENTADSTENGKAPGRPDANNNPDKPDAAPKPADASSTSGIEGMLDGEGKLSEDGKTKIKEQIRERLGLKGDKRPDRIGGSIQARIDRLLGSPDSDIRNATLEILKEIRDSGGEKLKSRRERRYMREVLEAARRMEKSKKGATPEQLLASLKALTATGSELEVLRKKVFGEFIKNWKGGLLRLLLMIASVLFTQTFEEIVPSR